MIRINEILDKTAVYLSEQEQALITKAYVFSAAAHAVDQGMGRIPGPAKIRAQPQGGNPPGKRVAQLPGRAVVHLGTVEPGHHQIAAGQPLHAPPEDMRLGRLPERLQVEVRKKIPRPQHRHPGQGAQAVAQPGEKPPFGHGEKRPGQIDTHGLLRRGHHVVHETVQGGLRHAEPHVFGQGRGDIETHDGPLGRSGQRGGIFGHPRRTLGKIHRAQNGLHGRHGGCSLVFDGRVASAPQVFPGPTEKPVTARTP